MALGPPNLLSRQICRLSGGAGWGGPGGRGWPESRVPWVAEAVWLLSKPLNSYIRRRLDRRLGKTRGPHLPRPPQLVLPGASLRGLCISGQGPPGGGTV